MWQNGNYMQDLNYYNQNPNYTYNPYMQNVPNNTYVSQNNMNMNNMGNTNNMNNTPMRQPQQNLNAMYPAVYRIISPVVSQVVSNNNTSYLTEDGLNSMVDTVYNIVEGDINLSNSQNTAANVTQNTTTENSSSNCSRANTTSTGREFNNYCKRCYEQVKFFIKRFDQNYDFKRNIVKKTMSTNDDAKCKYGNWKYEPQYVYVRQKQANSACFFLAYFDETENF